MIGSGYVGLVSGACFSDFGHDVVCVDKDAGKIDALKAGRMPIFEPGLDTLVAANVNAGRLTFTTDLKSAVAGADAIFIAVGTPSRRGDGHADLTYVFDATREIAAALTGPTVIVTKSTVPVGTGDKVEAILREMVPTVEVAVVSNPEFLREGAAIGDFKRPDRIVIGTNHDVAGLWAKEMMRKLYAPFNRHHERTYYMDVKSAELTKYAANAMLATRISFMNELANLADEVGADIEAVRQGIGSDSRIGYGFLYAGTGYGGSCFPKDVSALSQTAQQYGRDLKILEAVEAVNQAQKTILIEKIVKRFGENLTGHRFALWGLAFKPNTDDMREAPSRLIISELVKRGASILAHDPVAMPEAQRCLELDFKSHPKLLDYVKMVKTPEDALDQASALIIVTEWKAFRSPDFEVLKQTMKNPIIFDGRNLYEPQTMKELGFEYQGIGRHN